MSSYYEFEEELVFEVAELRCSRGQTETICVLRFVTELTARISSVHTLGYKYSCVV